MPAHTEPSDFPTPADDARLSAYALGELDETERAALEAEFPTPEALAQAVAEIQQTVDLLRAALADEPMPAPAELVQPAPLSPLLKQENYLMSSLTKWVGLAVALLLMCGIGIFMMGQSLNTKFGEVSYDLDGGSGQPSPDIYYREARSTKAPSSSRSEISEEAEYYRHALPTDSSPVATTPVAPSIAPPMSPLVHDRPEIANDSYRPTRESKPHPIDSPVKPGLDPADPQQIPDDGRGPGESGNKFERITENDFLKVTQEPLSTFSIDVDTASYALARRYITQNRLLPPVDAVRIEEFINYFNYQYSPPTDDVPFASHIEVAACPWAGKHRLVRVGLKGRVVESDQRPATNLVFLLDVSGSMNQHNKLPYVKESMKLLVDQLGENDRVAIVVYAGAAGLVLPSTQGDHKSDIINALDQLQAGGSTAGGAGIQLAYEVAVKNFIQGGVNRVILCSDGDFNVGVSSTAALERLAEEKAKTGVFLSVYGFGMGNLNDQMLEKISGKGNGTYGFIDSLNEAKKTFVEELSGTLVTIAKDVKIQIEFNPGKVAAYRLIGYENRLLAAQDFNDDKKDAGEIGAGHTVTALYEVIPAGEEVPGAKVDDLKYQKKTEVTPAADSDEMLTLKLRYKQPDGDTSKLLEFPVKDSDRPFGQASEDFKFAASVASFGMLLRHSKYAGDATFAAVEEMASSSKNHDPSGYRAEFVELVKQARQISGR